MVLAVGVGCRALSASYASGIFLPEIGVFGELSGVVAGSEAFCRLHR